MGGGKADGVDNASDAQQGEVNEQMMGGETQDGESLADSFDYCGEFELYDDDICHRFCFEPDPDCEGVLEEEEDFCNAYRESDGECSIPCGDVDPDCEDALPQDSDWVPDEEILSICRDINAGEHLLGFAEALCGDWADYPIAYPQCIEACMSANTEQ